MVRDHAEYVISKAVSLTVQLRGTWEHEWVVDTTSHGVQLPLYKAMDKHTTVHVQRCKRLAMRVQLEYGPIAHNVADDLASTGL